LKFFEKSYLRSISLLLSSRSILMRQLYRVFALMRWTFQALLDYDRVHTFVCQASSFQLYSFTAGNRHSQWAMASISSVSYRFVLWEAVSRTKYCCSLKIQTFTPPNFWVGYAGHHLFSCSPSPQVPVESRSGISCACVFQLLDRVFDIMRQKNPEMIAGEKKRFIMKPPQCARVGTKKTSFVNFSEICQT